MDIPREKIKLAFGVDRAVRLDESVLLRDPAFKQTKEFVSSLQYHKDRVRFLQHSSSYAKRDFIKCNPRMIRYYLGLQYGEIEYIVRSAPKAIKYLNSKNPVYKQLCREAVYYDGMMLKYISKQNNHMRSRAVKNDGLALQYCNKQTDDLCITAVLNDHNAIDYVLDKSQVFYLGILKKYPIYWRHVEDTIVHRKLAIASNELCIVLMDNISPDLIDWCLANNHGYILRYVTQTDPIIQSAITADPNNIRYIKDQTEALQERVIRIDPLSIKYIHRPTHHVLRLCVEIKPTSIDSICQTDELCWIALRKDPKSFALICHPTPDMCRYAVEKDAMQLEHVLDQTSEICEIAIRQNPKAFKYVLDQTQTLARLAVTLSPDNVKLVFPSIIDDIAYENKFSNL